MLLTRPPLHPKMPFDLHVLGTPPAFILSQDQTLHHEEFSPFTRLALFRVPSLKESKCLLVVPSGLGTSTHGGRVPHVPLRVPYCLWHVLLTDQHSPPPPLQKKKTSAALLHSALVQVLSNVAIGLSNRHKKPRGHSGMLGIRPQLSGLTGHESWCPCGPTPLLLDVCDCYFAFACTPHCGGLLRAASFTIDVSRAACQP